MHAFFRLVPYPTLTFKHRFINLPRSRIVLFLVYSTESRLSFESLPFRAVLTQKIKQSETPGFRRAQHTLGSHEQSSRSLTTGPSKSALALEISAFLHRYLSGFRIPTFPVESFISENQEPSPVMIPLEVSIWNVATGEYSKRFGLKDGTALTFPVIEHRHKSPNLGNPLLNEFHMYSLGLATPEQLRVINRLASKANIVLRSFLERRGLKLHRLGLEFCLHDGQIVIGGEISPRTSSIADMQGQSVSVKMRPTMKKGAPPRVVDAELLLEVRNRVCRTVPHEGS